LLALIVCFAISTTASGTTPLLRGDRDPSKEDSGIHDLANVDVHKKRSHAKNNIFDNNPSPTSKLPSSITETVSKSSSTSTIIYPKQTRIIGGTAVSSSVLSSSYQYIVSIQDIYSHYCAGTLIASDVVLTAAHCLGGSYKVIIGKGSSDVSLLSSSSSRSYSKLKEMKHPQYDSNNSNNDYGLIFLTSEVSTTNGGGGGVQQIVRLNQDNNYPSVGSSVTTVGWGDTNPTDEIILPSTTLQQVNLNIISNVDCEDSTDSKTGISYIGQITNNMICAHVKGGGKDACQVSKIKEREREIQHFSFSYSFLFLILLTPLLNHCLFDPPPLPPALLLYISSHLILSRLKG
jgi:trypsin